MEAKRVLLWWSVGIFLLAVALFISQQAWEFTKKLFSKRKASKRGFIFTHALPLPGFLLLSQNILQHASIAIQTEPQSIFGFDVPSQIVYLIGNVFTQYMCISSVYILTTECPSLTVTLVVTLRKFASLIFLIFYFKNSFTLHHWTGTALVLIRTLIFSRVFEEIFAKAYRKIEQKSFTYTRIPNKRIGKKVFNESVRC